jgi:hypothetical protein
VYVDKQMRVYDAIVGPIPNIIYQYITTFSNGCLGSHNDEERSEILAAVQVYVRISDATEKPLDAVFFFGGRWAFIWFYSTQMRFSVSVSSR